MITTQEVIWHGDVNIREVVSEQWTPHVMSCSLGQGAFISFTCVGFMRNVPEHQRSCLSKPTDLKAINDFFHEFRFPADVLRIQMHR